MFLFIPQKFTKTLENTICKQYSYRGHDQGENPDIEKILSFAEPEET